MTKHFNVWDGKPYVTFDDDYQKSDLSKVGIRETTLGYSLANFCGKKSVDFSVEHKFNNYSFFITLSLKNVIDVEDIKPYRDIYQWLHVNYHLDDALISFEYYNDKKNIHSHGIFNSKLVPTAKKMKSIIRKRLEKVYNKDIPSCAIDVKRISEYKVPDYQVALKYIKKDIEFMRMHNIHPMLLYSDNRVFTENII